MQNFFFITQNLLSREVSRCSALLFLAASLAALSGCGSGQALPQEFPVAASTSTTGPAVATVQLLVSSPNMPSSGATTVDVTAIVLSATKQAISGKTVTFSTGTDATAFVNNISASGVSDSNGLVTAKLNIGSNKSNRTITVSATADSAVGSNSVDVTGTTVTISGNGSIASGAKTTLTFSVKDSAGTALPGITVNVTSLSGNTITPASGTTGNSGQLTADVVGVVAGTDTITATLANVNAAPILTNATLTLTVSSSNFAFTAPPPLPAAPTEIPLGSAQTVTVNWTDTVTTPVGPVSFSTSRGTVSASTAPLVAGSSSVTVSSTTAGPAIITASGPSGTPAATIDVVFVATSASSVTAQAVPGTVQVTTGSTSQTSNSSTISALVRDAANNLVKNASVSFTITSDPSGGRLTSSTGTTDVSGVASVTYIAGSTSSGQSGTGVSITATVDKVGTTAIAPVSGTTSLIVSGQSLLVRLGTDNSVVSNKPAATTYSKTYSAFVTDSAGNPVVGTTVRFALRPGRFQKGYYIAPTPFTSWVKAATPTVCANEDTNFNGIVDFAAEDTNANGQLDPGGSAVVNASAVTDASGAAQAVLTYNQDHASWAEVILEARTGVVGNDPPAVATFYLPGAAADYNTASIAPPGQISPFGAGIAPNNVCSNTN